MAKLFWFAVPYAFLSYLSSRGPDGDIFPNVYLILATGALYGILVWRSPRSSVLWLACHLLVFLCATGAPFLVPPYAEEMGGMVYLILPVVIVSISLVVAIAVFVVRPRLRRAA